MTHAPKCRDCRSPLQCTCCGMAPHEGSCELRSSICEACSEQWETDPAHHSWLTMIESPDFEPVDPDDVLDTDVAELSIEALDALLEQHRAA